MSLKLLDPDFKTLILQSSFNTKPDRDSSRWRLEPREVQKRRALFWELFITDSWQVCTLLSGNRNDIVFILLDCHRVLPLVDLLPLRYPT